MCQSLRIDPSVALLVSVQTAALCHHSIEDVLNVTREMIDTCEDLLSELEE